MNRKMILLTIAAAIALTIPAASAQWMSHGTYEPSTPWDDSRYMFETATDATDQIYFNAYAANNPYVGTNPNVGATESRFYPMPTVSWNAVLGVWVDCNGDKYIGEIESALIEYRVEMLPSTSVCRGEGYERHIHDGWVREFLFIGMIDPTTHDAQKDHEATAHTYEDFNYSFDPAIIYAQGTRVWGDIGIPGTPGGQSCPVAPPPAGTSSNTGRTIRFIDCLNGGIIAAQLSGTDFEFEGCDTRNAPNTGYDTEDPEGQANQEEFEDRWCRQAPHESDAYDPETGEGNPLIHTLPVSLKGNPYHHKNETGKWQHKTGLIENDSEDPAFRTWDCNAENGRHTQETQPVNGTAPETKTPEFDLSEVTGDQNDTIGAVTVWDGVGPWVNYSAPNVDATPALNDPTGVSYWDGVRYALQGSPGWSSQACEPQDGNAALGSWHGLATFYVEGDHEAPGFIRTASNLPFVFATGGGMRVGTDRAYADETLDESMEEADQEMKDVYGNWQTNRTKGWRDNFSLVGMGERNYTFLDETPYDVGLGAVRPFFGPAWWPTTSYLSTGQNVNRATFQPAGVSIWTFYAYVDIDNATRDYTRAGFLAPALKVPSPSAEFIYGSEACGTTIGPNAPILNLWLCDPDQWWKSPSGSDVASRHAPHQKNDRYEEQAVDENGEPICEFAEDAEEGDECEPKMVTKYRPGFNLGGTVGDQYQFRDVDCYDGHVYGGVLYASFTQEHPNGTCDDIVLE